MLSSFFTQRTSSHDPPRWVDEDGQRCPTRPSEVRAADPHQACASGHRPRRTVARVERGDVGECCWHQVEVVLVSDSAERFREIRVLGAAT